MSGRAMLFLLEGEVLMGDDLVLAGEPPDTAGNWGSVTGSWDRDAGSTTSFLITSIGQARVSGVSGVGI